MNFIKSATVHYPNAIIKSFSLSTRNYGQSFCSRLALLEDVGVDDFILRNRISDLEHVSCTHAVQLEFPMAYQCPKVTGMLQSAQCSVGLKLG